MNPVLGAPRKISDTKVERVLTLTLESTLRGATQWQSRPAMRHEPECRVADLAGLCPAAASDRNFQAVEEPALYRQSSGHSRSLYMNAPDRALVLCVDGKSQIQALGPHAVHCHCVPTWPRVRRER